MSEPEITGTVGETLVPADGATATALADAGVEDGDAISLTPEAQANADAMKAAKAELPKPSETRATKGRIVLFYHKDFRFGPYPADVVADFGGSVYANVNVKVDGCNEREFLASIRERPDGNTFGSATVYDPLTTEQRLALLAAGVTYWAEWMPYQKGQAAKTEAAEGELAKRVAAVEAAAFSTPGGSVVAAIKTLAHGIGRPDTIAEINKLLP